MATSSVMFGSSSTTRTLAPSLFTMVMLIEFPVKLLRKWWAWAWALRPAVARRREFLACKGSLDAKRAESEVNHNSYPVGAAPVAQGIEQDGPNVKVGGSIPSG